MDGNEDSCPLLISMSWGNPQTFRGSPPETQSDNSPRELSTGDITSLSYEGIQISEVFSTFHQLWDIYPSTKPTSQCSTASAPPGSSCRTPYTAKPPIPGIESSPGLVFPVHLRAPFSPTQEAPPAAVNFSFRSFPKSLPCSPTLSTLSPFPTN